MEKRPWEIQEGVTLAAMRVARCLRDTEREAVREEGITHKEIVVLLTLRDGTYNTARDISRLRRMPRSLVSRTVDQLMKRGYVGAVRDPEDRRVVRLALLPPAREVVARLEQARAEFFSRLTRGISPEEWETFFHMAEKMLANLGDEPLEEELEQQEG